MKSKNLIFTILASMILLNSCYRAISNLEIPPEIGLAITLAQASGIIVDPTGSAFDNYVVIKSSQLANPVDRANSYDIGAYGKFTVNGMNANVGPININNRAILADPNNLYQYIYDGNTLSEGKSLFGSNLEITTPGIDNPNSTTPLGINYIVVPKEIFPSNIPLPGTRINRSVDYSLSWNPDPNNQYQKVQIDVSYFKALSQFNTSGLPNSIASLTYRVPDNGNFIIPISDLSRFPVGAFISISIARASMVSNTNNVVYVAITEAHTIPILVVDNSSFCLSAQTISGDNNFCTTSNNYSIPNLPDGAKVTWDATPLGVVTINSPNSPQTNITANSNGKITLSAVVSDACGGPISISKSNILVGSPFQPGQISFTLIDPVTGKIHAVINSVEGATSYNWYKNGVMITNPPVHGVGIQIPIPKNICDIEYDISVEAFNDCGLSSQSHANAYVPCDNYYLASPNPVSNNIIVSTDQTKSVKSRNTTFDEVRIFDMQGNLKKYQKFNFVSIATINISTLLNGQYYIEISNGIYKEKKLLLIQH